MKISVSVSVANMLVLIYQYRYRQKYRLGEYIGIGWTHIGQNLRCNPMCKHTCSQVSHMPHRFLQYVYYDAFRHDSKHACKHDCKHACKHKEITQSSETFHMTSRGWGRCLKETLQTCKAQFFHLCQRQNKLTCKACADEERGPKFAEFLSSDIILSDAK